MYISPTAKPISEIPFQQVRLGLQGAPGEGKTYAALTFPNPVVIDLDNKLGVHKERKDVLVVPFWSSKFVNETLKISNKPFANANTIIPFKDPRAGLDPNLPPNRRDAVLYWLETEAQKLENDQTLVLDSWTSLQAAFDQAISFEPVYSRDNKINDFAPWQSKIEYSAKICSALKSLNCHVVATFHEMPQRDPKTGLLLEKIQPLMQGKFTTQIASHFTDFFRQCAVPKTYNKGKEIVKISIPGNSSYTLSQEVEYFWQIQADDEFAATSTLTKVGPGVKFVPATYDSFLKYRI